MANRRLGNGRYEIRSLIGRGGMAEVHLGYDSRLSRKVAVKMLRIDLAQDSIFLARFRREAQSAASLNHPNIVGIYDTGEETIQIPDGSMVQVPYIVMEYVEGHTVRELLTDGQPVPINEAVEIMDGVLYALEYSHAHGLVHRDIKPGNVMLTNDGKVKVMDFGIARAMEDSAATMTKTDAVVGTAQYLSPEQAKGGQVDQRSDLYSAGCMLYELLTGKAPFSGDSAVSIAYQHVSETPKTPSALAPDIPEALDRVVMKSLAKDPENRYQNAGEMIADMHSAVRGQAVDAPETSVWKTQTAQATQALPALDERLTPAQRTQLQQARSRHEQQLELQETKKRKRRRIVIAIVSIALVLVAAAIAALLLFGGDKKDETVLVPDLVGKTQAEANQALTDVGLVMAQGDSVPSETVAKGLVAKTDPPAGRSVAPGSTVKLMLSSGPASTMVPDVTDKPQEEARLAIEEAGLKVGNVTTEDSATVDADHVIRTDPESGSEVPEGTVINIVVASGYVELNAADVIGKPREQAIDYLNKLGLNTNTETRETSEQPEGAVVSVTPTGKLKSGSNVTITIAKAPPEEPTESPTTSTSPSPAVSPGSAGNSSGQ